MRFTIDTQELCAGISTVTKALGTKTTISILEGIYCQAEKDSLLLRCTDLSLQIETQVPATVEEDGALVMPGRLFSEMARKLPGETTFLSANNKNLVSLQSGRAKSTIQAERAEDFHNMPAVRQEFAVKIKKLAFKSMIRQCIFASAQDDSRPILTGVLFEIENGTLSMVALDGYRLALRRESIEQSFADQNVVVPARSLLEISRILEDTEDMISIVFSKTHLMIDMGYTRITTRLMDGEFSHYKQVMPESHTTRVRVDRQELLDSIERVSLMARENKKNHIKFLFEAEKVTISANSDIGNSDEELAVSSIGSDLEIAFNARFFSDVLKVLPDQEVYLDMNNNISPCVVRPIQGEEYYYLILPVRLFL